MIRCSKCGNFPMIYTEIWKDHTISFQINRDGSFGPKGELEPGYPYCVYAHCICGHYWRLRRINQITQVEGYQKEN